MFDRPTADTMCDSARRHVRLVLVLQAVWISSVCLGAENCDFKCGNHISWNEWEKCLRDCYAAATTELSMVVTTAPPRVEKVYPRPPEKVDVRFTMHVEQNLKFIRAQVVWEANADAREGFYLSFLAATPACELKFPGFHTAEIPKHARSWMIPAQSLSLHPLTIQHGCTYKLEMRSKPYQYGDPMHSYTAEVTVPLCVDGYCNCAGQAKLPSPTDISVYTFINTNDTLATNLSWNFNFGKLPMTDKVEFHVKLADYYQRVPFGNRIKLYKFRQPFDFIIAAQRDILSYWVVLPDVKNLSEHKIQLFAVNQHLCRSQDVFHYFTAEVRGAAPSSQAGNNTNNDTLLSSVTEAPPAGPKDGGQDKHPKAGAPSAFQILRHDYLLIFLPIIGALCLVITVFTVCRLSASRREKAKQKQAYLEHLKSFPWTLVNANGHAQYLETNLLYTEKEIADAQAQGVVDHFEVSYDRLKFGRAIGQGAFGLVYLGLADTVGGIPGSTTVAIKQLKANADEGERKQFLAEIDMLKKVNTHPNIVNMLGCCTLQHPQCMVMEYVPHGDLLHYLRNLRKEYELQTEHFRLTQYSSSSFDTAKHSVAALVEMHPTHLNNPGYYHEADLTAAELVKGGDAAKGACQCGTCEIKGDIPFADSDVANQASGEDALQYSLDPIELQSFALQVASGMAHLELLKITHRDLAARNILVGRGKILKISDFGLSKVGIYVKTTSGRIPLRWLSVEAMRDHIYTTKSDVWAYGIVLWEICTLGGFPYPSVSDRELLKFLESGNRLEKPTSCSDTIYQLMKACWSHAPADRPSFHTIRQTLDRLNDDANPYVEFRALDCLPPEGYCRLAMESSMYSNASSNLATWDLPGLFGGD